MVAVAAVLVWLLLRSEEGVQGTGPPPVQSGRSDAGSEDSGRTDSTGEEKRQPRRDRVESVVDDLGLRADITDCEATLNGEPLEGPKLLLALGDRLFLNTHQIFPGRTKTRVSESVSYGYCLERELDLIYAHMVKSHPDRHDEALRVMARYASRLPTVLEANGSGTGVDILYDRQKEGKKPILVGSEYGPAYAGTSDVYKECVAARKERRIEDRFLEIVRALDSGGILHTEKGTEYRVEH